MNPLPVFATFRNAVKFVFANILTIVRLAWLPLLVLAAAQYFIQMQIMRAQIAALGAAGPGISLDEALSAAQSVAPLSLLLTALSILAVSIVAVALHRVILFDDRKPGTYILFSFGPAERTYALMAVLYAFGVAAIFLVIMWVATAILLPAAGSAGDLVIRMINGTLDPNALKDSALFGLVMALAAILVVIVVARLMVLPAAVVATGRLAVSESLALTRGNVWRIVGLWFVTMFAILVALMIVASLFLPPVIKNAWLPIMRDSGFALDAAGMRSMLNWKLDHLLELTALNYCVTILGTALGVGLVSYSYKALKGVPAGKPLPSSS